MRVAEEQRDRVPAQIGEAKGSTALIGQLEVRRERSVRREQQRNTDDNDNKCQQTHRRGYRHAPTVSRRPGRRTFFSHLEHS
jgi:hypothetical protein